MSVSFEETYNIILNFFHTNLYITIALAVVLLYLLIRKPKVILVLLLILTVLSGAFYVISHIASEGSKTKDGMIKVKELPQ